MKIRLIVLLVLTASALLWMPVQSEAALLEFSGNVGYVYPPPPQYTPVYNGHTFVVGKSMTGGVEYDAIQGTVLNIWMDVPDVDNEIYHFETTIQEDNPTGTYSFDGTTHVFEFQGNMTLPGLYLSGLSLGSTGTWSFDFDSEDPPPFRMGGTAQVVPIPAAVWLLGTGIVGLSALRRKVQK